VDLIKQRHWAGEGNGGIIYQSRIMVAFSGCLFLTHLANKKMKVSALRASYPGVLHEQNKIN
jgi:phosphomannomutase